MINILSQSGITDSKLAFKILNGKCERLREAVGTVFDITGYVLSEQENADGEIVKILSITTDTGRVYGTNSPTVVRTFESMILTFPAPTPETPLTGITVRSCESKKGRTYIDLDFAE